MEAGNEIDIKILRGKIMTLQESVKELDPATQADEIAERKAEEKRCWDKIYEIGSSFDATFWGADGVNLDISQID